MSSPVTTFPHGSPLGFRLGCTSHGGCRWRGSADWLTCVEARTAAFGDAAVRALPPHLPIPRSQARRALVAQQASLRHGTVHGYRRGCTTPAECPTGEDGRTCAAAAQEYRAAYRTSRTSGAGTRIEHGTLRGYHAGCMDEARCPGGPLGRTCTEARRAHRIEAARARGVPERAVVDASEAAALLHVLRAAGTSVREIARRYGVGRTTVAGLLAALDRGEQPVAKATTLSRIGSAAG